MTQKTRSGVSRRDVLKTTGAVAAAGALAGVVVPHVYAGETNLIKVALVINLMIISKSVIAKIMDRDLDNIFISRAFDQALGERAFE